MVYVDNTLIDQGNVICVPSHLKLLVKCLSEYLKDSTFLLLYLLGLSYIHFPRFPHWLTFTE